MHPSSSAFPWESRDESLSEPGLTKREYIAALILQGLCANGHNGIAHLAAKKAVEFTDTLIDELNKP